MKDDIYKKTADAVATMARLGHGLNAYDLASHAHISQAEAARLLSGACGDEYHELWNTVKSIREGRSVKGRKGAK